jgi:hypothetical protein
MSSNTLNSTVAILISGSSSYISFFKSWLARNSPSTCVLSCIPFLFGFLLLVISSSLCFWLRNLSLPHMNPLTL